MVVVGNIYAGGIMNKKVIAIVLSIVIIAGGVLLWSSFSKDKMKGSLTEITAEECQKKIENKETFIVFIGKSTCDHCKEYDKNLKEFMKDHGLHMYKVIADSKENVGESFDELYKTYFPNLITVPTTYYIVDGEVVDESVGKRDETQIILWIKRLGLEIDE